jgi:hypothetical protein
MWQHSKHWMCSRKIMKEYLARQPLCTECWISARHQLVQDCWRSGWNSQLHLEKVRSEKCNDIYRDWDETEDCGVFSWKLACESRYLERPFKNCKINNHITQFIVSWLGETLFQILPCLSKTSSQLLAHWLCEGIQHDPYSRFSLHILRWVSDRWGSPSESGCIGSS